MRTDTKPRYELEVHTEDGVSFVVTSSDSERYRQVKARASDYSIKTSEYTALVWSVSGTAITRSEAEMVARKWHAGHFRVIDLRIDPDDKVKWYQQTLKGFGRNE